MTMPPDSEGSYSLLGQILVRQGEILLKQGEMATQLAVIGEQIKDVPDHEQRLRQVERVQAASAGGRDTWARVLAGLATAGAVAAAWASLMHR